MFHFSATFRKNTVRCLALALLLSAAALTPALAAVPQTAAMQESSRSAAQSGGPEKQAPLSAGKTQSSPSQAAPKTGPARTLPQAPKKQSVPPKDSGITLTISAAGDCTLGTDENFGYDGTFAAAYDAADWDASVFLKGVEPVFRNDDLTIVNLEGPLSEGGVRQEKTFAFRGPSHYVNVLTAGSVEAATLANNHSYDYGEDAYWDTFRTLGEAGVMPFGYEESQILSVKGIPVGLAGINDLAGGAEEPSISTGARNLPRSRIRTRCIWPIWPSTAERILSLAPIPMYSREWKHIKEKRSATVWAISALAETATRPIKIR